MPKKDNLLIFMQVWDSLFMHCTVQFPFMIGTIKSRRRNLGKTLFCSSLN